MANVLGLLSVVEVVSVPIVVIEICLGYSEDHLDLVVRWRDLLVIDVVSLRRRYYLSLVSFGLKRVDL